MKARSVALIAMCAFVVAATVAAEDKPKPKLDLKGIKCVMNAKGDATEANALDYRGGKVYFCCENCPKKFDPKKTAAQATAANHQLVATKQAKQEVCPFTGGKLNPETKVKVKGAEVCFCCNNCKGKFEKEENEEKRVELVFSDAAFDKAKFKVAKEEKKDEKK